MSQPMTEAADALGARTIHKVRLRLIPYMFVCYAIAYLDRVNVGFAALEMNQDLALSDSAYALGAGLFFWGYALLEVPSNLILARVGARVWIARIMIGWGVVSSAMMFIQGPWSFAAFRLALGVAEAGFFPGMILYLTYWFPTVERAKAVAFFMTATALTGVVGGPLSGLLMQLDGALGLRGWQWLFLLEGIPAIVFGVTTLYYLTDRPEQATWLETEEREWLVARLASEKGVETHAHSFAAALKSPVLWLFCAIYFCNNVGFYGLTFWLPKIVQNFSGLGTLGTTMLTALPYTCAVVVMVSVAMHSDLRRERKKHVAVVSATGAVGLLLASQAGTPLGGLLALCLTACGIWSVMGPFWALVTATLSNTAAAGAIAFINSIGNLGGFFGPQVIAFAHGHASDFATLAPALFPHQYSAALFFLAGAPITLAVLVLLVPTRKAQRGTQN